MAVAEPRPTTHRTLWLLCFCLALVALHASFQLADVAVEIDQHATPWCVATLPFPRVWFALLVVCIAVKCGLHVMVLVPVLCRYLDQSIYKKAIMAGNFFFIQGNMVPMLWLAHDPWIWFGCVMGIAIVVMAVWKTQSRQTELLNISSDTHVRNSVMISCLAFVSIWILFAARVYKVPDLYVILMEIGIVSAIFVLFLVMSDEEQGTENSKVYEKYRLDICLMLALLDASVFHFVVESMMYTCLGVTTMVTFLCESFIFVAYSVEYANSSFCIHFNVNRKKLHNIPILPVWIQPIPFSSE